MDRPSEDEELSTERISFRCTPSLKRAITAAAKRDKRKPAQWIIIALEDRLGELQKFKTVPNSGKTEAAAS